MNTNKHNEYFDPNKFTEEVHIIGVGAGGSTLAENLTRLGIKKLHLYDFDTVTPHNIANQMFWEKHINMLKIEAMAEQLLLINPDIELVLHPKGWIEGVTMLKDYIFLCVDDIETRQKIIKDNYYNQQIIAMFDGRMRLTDAQHFAATWDSDTNKDFLLKTMDFTKAEADLETPVSACGTTLNVVFIVRAMTALIVANFIKLINTGTLYKTNLIDLDLFIMQNFKQ